MLKLSIIAAKNLFALSCFFMNPEITTHTIQPIITPHTTVFVFDFHGVIATESPYGMLKKGFAIFKQHPHKIELLSKLVSFGINKFLKFDQKQLCIEYALIHNESNEITKQASLALINPHEINSDMLAILKRLHHQGYKLFLCSNIGQQSFEQYLHIYPELRYLFHGAHVCNEHNNYTTKTCSRAFELCKSMIDNYYQEQNLAIPSTIILVDDSRSKLHRALRTHHAYYGIHFTTINNFETLLDQWGIPRE